MREIVEDRLDHVWDVKLHRAAVEMGRNHGYMPLLDQRTDLPGIREIDAPV